MTKLRQIDDAIGAHARLVLDGAECLVQGRSAHQHYEVWQTPAFGRLYRLDGHFMAAEADEYRGHESLVHVAALAHPTPRRALVLGGGDGGSARELLRHPGIECVVVAELDASVVELCRRHLPALEQGVFDNARVELRIGDALDYVAAALDEGVVFDLIVFDLTDAGGSAAALHETDFLRRCRRLLTPDGLAVVQLGSAFHQRAQLATIGARLASVFEVFRPYVVDLPLYGGGWMLACVSARTDPCRLTPDEIERRLCERGIAGLRHYNGDIHRAQFALSNDLRRLFDFGDGHRIG